MEHLNEKVLELIFEIQDTFPGDSELLEFIRDLNRVSKFLLRKELKKFDDENKDNQLYLIYKLLVINLKLCFMVL